MGAMAVLPIVPLMKSELAAAVTPSGPPYRVLCAQGTGVCTAGYVFTLHCYEIKHGSRERGLVQLIPVNPLTNSHLECAHGLTTLNLTQQI